MGIRIAGKPRCVAHATSCFIAASLFVRTRETCTMHAAVAPLHNLGDVVSEQKRLRVEVYPRRDQPDDRARPFGARKQHVRASKGLDALNESTEVTVITGVRQRRDNEAELLPASPSGVRRRLIQRCHGATQGEGCSTRVQS